MVRIIGDWAKIEVSCEPEQRRRQPKAIKGRYYVSSRGDIVLCTENQKTADSPFEAIAIKDDALYGQIINIWYRPAFILFEGKITITSKKAIGLRKFHVGAYYIHKDGTIVLCSEDERSTKNVKPTCDGIVIKSQKHDNVGNWVELIEGKYEPFYGEIVINTEK